MEEICGDVGVESGRTGEETDGDSEGTCKGGLSGETWILLGRSLCEICVKGLVGNIGVAELDR